MNLKSKISSLPSINKTIQNNFTTPKKSLGQNFILNLNVTNKIARLADCSKKKIIEIGPGPISITFFFEQLASLAILFVTFKSRIKF